MLGFPASGVWNRKLAVLGVDNERRRAEEVGLLVARGYAVASFSGSPGALRATLAAASAECVRRESRSPAYTILLCEASHADAALRLAQQTPQAFQALVAAGLPAAADNESMNLDAFAAAGGRIIVFHDPADARASLDRALGFYARLEQRAGSLPAAAAYARLFLLPDSPADPDCNGWRTDWLLLAEKWLEQLPPRPPDDPVLWRAEGRAGLTDGLFAPVAPDPALIAESRPVYPYPLRVLYKGRGDRKNWRSWYAPGIYRRDRRPPRRDELPAPIDQPQRPSVPLDVDPRIGPVAVVGATGRLGVAIVLALRQHGVAVRPIARDAHKAAQRLPDDVPSVIADVRDAAALERALQGARRVVFAASATAGGSGGNTPRAVEYEGVRKLVEVARTARIEQILLVSSAACTQPEHIHNLWGDILKWKLRSEQLLRSSGMPYTILRPTGLRAQPGGQRGIRFVQGDRIALGEEICRADVASLCVAALGDQRALGKTFEAYNDDSLPPGGWVGTFGSVAPDDLI